VQVAIFLRSLILSSALLAVGCETQFKMPQQPGAGASALPTAGIGGASAGGISGGAAGIGGDTSTAGTAGVGTAGTGVPQAGMGPPAGSGGIGSEGGLGGTMATSGGVGGGGVGGGGTGGDAPVEPQTCPATSALVPGETTVSIQAGGRQRAFILHVPASYTGQTPVPLVLDFHGILMSSGLERTLSGWADVSETAGFIVAFPEGTDTAFNVGICCTSSSAVDDLAFARAIVEHVSQQGCVDRKRVHSVGYSMGGGMSMHLACNAADVFASIAISAFDLMPEEDWPCAPSRPIAILSFRSTGDAIVPYAGAVDTIPPNGTATLVTFIGAEANLAKWAALDGCTGAAADMGGGCKLHTTCSAGVEVGLCTKQGGGHDFMEAAAGWAFLERHPMP
jgi:polyhydroxybutyrate depolymerase